MSGNLIIGGGGYSIKHMVPMWERKDASKGVILEAGGVTCLTRIEGYNQRKGGDKKGIFLMLVV